MKSRVNCPKASTGADFQRIAALFPVALSLLQIMNTYALLPGMCCASGVAVDFGVDVDVGLLQWGRNGARTQAAFCKQRKGTEPCAK